MALQASGAVREVVAGPLTIAGSVAIFTVDSAEFALEFHLRNAAGARCRPPSPEQQLSAS